MSSVTPEIHETLGQGHVTDLASRRTYEQAWRQFAQHQSTEEFCSSWLVIQAHAIGGVSDGVVVLVKPGTNAFAPVAFFPDTPRDRSHLAKIGERAQVFDDQFSDVHAGEFLFESRGARIVDDDGRARHFARCTNRGACSGL